MKITIVIGSARLGRQSHKVAYYLEKILKERDIQTELIDLGKESLPIMDEQVEEGSELADKIQAISRRLEEADALILVTPEYHGSFSGVLKNALDYFWAEFKKKPIGVVTASAGKMGGINASTQLQHVILSLGGFPLPLKLLIPEVQDAFNESFEPVRAGIDGRAHKFLDEFFWFADAVYRQKTRKLAGAV